MDIWHDAQDTCSTNSSTSCRPLSIVYGHWAARGVEPRKWSVGLDSGCVYGRRLTALVIEGDDFARRRRRDVVDAGADDDDQPEDNDVSTERLKSEDITIAGRSARLVSISCPAP